MFNKLHFTHVYVTTIAHTFARPEEIKRKNPDSPLSGAMPSFFYLPSSGFCCDHASTSRLAPLEAPSPPSCVSSHTPRPRPSKHSDSVRCKGHISCPRRARIPTPSRARIPRDHESRMIRLVARPPPPGGTRTKMIRLRCRRSYRIRCDGRSNRLHSSSRLNAGTRRSQLE